MKLGKDRIRQVFVYKQKPKDNFNSFKERTNFVGDFNIRSGNRKRVLGKTAKAMASTLALNLDTSEFDGICLRVNAKEFEGLIRNGATVPLTDDICRLDPLEIQAVLNVLSGEGLSKVQVDNG